MTTFTPRALALPALALAVIFALAQAHGPVATQDVTVTPTVYRAVNCAAPAKTLDASCTLAGSDLTIVR
jgi:hypothetical protein